MSFLAIDRIPVCVVLWLVACIIGCSSHVQKDDSTGAPIECTQYEAALDRCYHRRTQFANQAALLPKSDEARERIRHMCISSLEQLKGPCGPAIAPSTTGP